nr:putative uncharacterized protein DDB_G0290521 [Cherax quadricarinatus]
MSGLLNIGTRAASLRRRHHHPRSSSAHSSPNHSPGRNTTAQLTSEDTVLPSSRSAPSTPGHLSAFQPFTFHRRPDRLNVLAPQEASQGDKNSGFPQSGLRRRTSSRNPLSSPQRSPSPKESRNTSSSPKGSRSPSPSTQWSQEPSVSPKESPVRSSPSLKDSHTSSPSVKGSHTLSPRGSWTPSLTLKESVETLHYCTSPPSIWGSHTPSLSLRECHTPAPALSLKECHVPTPALSLECHPPTPGLSLKACNAPTSYCRESSTKTPQTPNTPYPYSTFDFEALDWGLCHVQHQVSVDDRRQLFSAGKINIESGMSAYGSIVYQMRDANMDSNSTCEFVYKALKVISKTGEFQ